MPLSDPQGPFTRLCQAAILISRVEDHVRRTVRLHAAHDPNPFSMEEVCTLIDDATSFSSITASELAAAAVPSPNSSSSHNTMAYSTTDHHTYSAPFTSQSSPRAFTSAGTAHPSPLSTGASPHSNTSSTPPSLLIPSLLAARFLAFSAQILLYDTYCCPEDLLTSGPGSSTEIPKSAPSLAMQVRAVSGIRAVSLECRDAGMELLDFVLMPANLARTGPLILDSLYASMATLHWLWKEGGEEDIRVALEDVKRVLARLDMRWRLARDYLGLERYHDVTTAMEWRAAG